MQTVPIKKKHVARAVAVAVVALGTTQAFGTGFQLNEQSASSIGNAFAAGAAFTDDVSGMWWNPAALSQFSKTQVTAGLNIIVPSIKFSNNASQPAGCYPPACSPAALQPLGNNGGDAGGYNYTPNLSMVVPINQQWAFGLGINVPFGLVTEYDDGWIGRYQGLKSKIETLNVNPALSWKITPQFAVGVGVNYQQVKATLTQNVNYSGALLQAAAGAGVAPGSPTFNAIAGLTPGLDSKATITADDYAWGWNIGLAWDATPQLRLGASYRSEIKYSASGNVNFENPTVALPPGTPPQLAGTIAALSGGVNSQALYGRGVSADITLPAIANLSFVYKVNQQWEVMGDAQYTGWSSIPQLAFTTTSPPSLPTVPLNWDDSWKFAVGASYKVSDQWKARFGVAYDQTPVQNDPTVRLPDSDRWWLAIGGEYKWTPNWKFDAGFVYIFADSPSFNQNQGSTASNALVNGSYDASVWILSMQATYTF
jgi:long-chain fatty acid transport protein